ncbi:dihydrofolate reductase [Candidatus Beckwithbacteria bacterium]|nr:dihydrofolate reductase [Candidatus Beckwithbacteria bacterium]
MKIFLIAAITLDGFIAREAGQSSFDWTSPEDRTFFIKKTKEAGVVIMGKTTYQTIGKPLKDRLNIIYTSKPLKSNYDNLVYTNQKPQALLSDFKKQGYKKIAICGGASIYSLFMKSGLVDHMYLTVEPHLFGQGVKLFNDQLDCKLKLLSSKKLNERGTMLLEYRVI